MRLYVDYLQFNKVTIKNNYPLPKIEDLMDQLVGAYVFSNINLISGFHQIRVKDEDIPKNTFRTRYGHYEYSVISFDVSNASDEDHVGHVCIVLHVLKENKLYAKLSKCDFWLQEVSFLGHVISSGSIVVDPIKMDVVLQWEVPKSVTEIISFLGLAGYYRKFIEGFSKLSLPLTQLTRKGQAFMWDIMCEENFQKLKKLTTTPILIFPDPKEPFVVYYGASKMGLGGVLMKNGQVVTYASR
ncbi:uncharacterized mitochondrial protein AtMg00860-like [Lathyrus oleraceus]|uniref:uncharacterized mitochondrial protein AtMg00860-like n=1 Tax=Pisum sativum TaxID=3888 RepID=UPI0021D1201D|nr:uncharacterized mitochondrial protein AtMg00860-like [Pisum sativum]